MSTFKNNVPWFYSHISDDVGSMIVPVDPQLCHSNSSSGSSFSDRNNYNSSAIIAASIDTYISQHIFSNSLESDHCFNFNNTIKSLTCNGKFPFIELGSYFPILEDTLLNENISRLFDLAPGAQNLSLNQYLQIDPEYFRVYYKQLFSRGINSNDLKHNF